MSAAAPSKADPRTPLPPIPAKRYFTIGEVSELCGVKPHVLRYWEQEFTQLRPMKRRGNRRYYQHHEVLLVRRIRELLYEQGFTISGARNRLGEAAQNGRRKDAAVAVHAATLEAPETLPVEEPPASAVQALRADLLAVLALLHHEPTSRG
ncbi:MAG: MerR family transcriptional regulator [Burkholderiaceae bacterium]|jgi:DNA-binding transcriptional MerR regulator|nr:MerR family transcriptional regulator [Burkholderiales bacterium]MCZ8337104.1 MerR family transcriptional regulator [Burkholderiaceae bacterium]